MPTIAIVGCGAMGSVYAAHMAGRGFRVHAITDWPEHAAAMARGGLRMESFSGERTVQVEAASSTAGIGEVDLVIIATKAADVEDAARSALPLLGPRTLVQTLQNGLGSAEKVAAIAGKDRTVVGIAGGFGASMVGPGHVHHNGMEIVQFGALGQVPPDDLLASVEIWKSAGFNAEICEDTDQMIWRKLLVNVTVSAVCCLTGLRVREVLGDAHAWPIARASLLEAVAVAVAKGIELRIDDPVEHVMRIAEKIPEARPSMLLDHLAQRPSEIDAINGAVVREGEALGVPTPTNATLVSLVKAREAHFLSAQSPVSDPSSAHVL